MTSTKGGYINWIFNYLIKHPVISIIVFFTSVIEPAIYMLPLYFSANIVEVLLDGGGWIEVKVILIVLLPIALFQVLLFFVSSFTNEILAHRVTTDITFDLFKQMQGRSLSYHDAKDTGKAMTLSMNDTRSLNMMLNPAIRMILAAFTIWGVAGIFLSFVDTALVISLFITSIFFMILVIRYRRKVGPLSTRVLNELGDVSSITSDSITGIRDIKSYHAEKIFTQKFSRRVYKQAISKELEGRAGTIFSPSLLVLFATTAMISYTIFLTSIGQVSFRNLVLVTTVLGLVNGFSGEFKWISFLMSAGLASGERLHKFMFEEDSHRVEDGVIPFDSSSSSIEFRKVNFSFELRDKEGNSNGWKNALSNVSFKIDENETVAIVGGPGSGKSSLTKLIQRLYIPQSGKILIGGVPINSYENKSLRRNMATVEQEVFLFNDSIMENIRFGRPEASDVEVQATADIAQAHEFISEFEEGYQTEIGDNGVRLSGGQAQRVAIARALIINPTILLFDDGASALDARTEQKIQQAISEILKTRTTVITTHRLAIIAKADRVLILDKGEVVGFGTHKELIMENHHYRKFFERHYKLPILKEVQ